MKRTISSHWNGRQAFARMLVATALGSVLLGAASEASATSIAAVHAPDGAVTRHIAAMASGQVVTLLQSEGPVASGTGESILQS